jgi:hypothetical protein
VRYLFCVPLIIVSVSGCFKAAASSSVPSSTPVAAAPSASAPTANPAPAASTPLDEVGIPIYPGSTKVALAVSKPAENGSKRVSAEYTTADSPDKVADFYQSKLGLNRASPPGTKLNQLVGKTGNGTFVQILVNPDGSDKSKIQYYFILMPVK